MTAPEATAPSRLRQAVWWLQLALATALPALLDWGVRGFGGHVVASVYYSDYRDALSLSFLVSLGLVLTLLQRPSGGLGLRFVFGFLLTLAWLVAALMPRPTCVERLYLGTQGVTAPQLDQADEGGAGCGR